MFLGCQNDIWLYIAILFISINRMHFLAPNLDNTDYLFTLVITADFCLHPIEVASQDQTSGSL